VLRDLHIRNLAVIADVSIELGPGFNVLSGETGAGKSIVVDALALLCGGRAATDLIRTGADRLTVTGVFEPRGDGWREPLAAAGLEAADELVIRREVAKTGRSRAFVDDKPVTLKLLAELAPFLVRIHGQREELGLRTPDLQRAWLDRCGGTEGAELAARTAAAYERWRRLAARRARLTGDRRARDERIDFLRFQIVEIDDARIEPGEEEELRRERAVLRHAEAIRSALDGATAALYEQDGAAYELLESGRRQLLEITDWEPEAEGWAAELEELRIRTGELADVLRRRLGDLEVDPGRLGVVEDRLAVLERLLKKHGPTSAEVLRRRDELAAELDELSADDDALEGLEAEVAAALDDYREAAVELSRARTAWGGKLARRVLRELRQLALDRARFEVAVERRTRQDGALELAGDRLEPSPAGIDRVTFRFSPNPGEELRPLARVASGGELARLYLAVQLAARRGEEASAETLVFDEVDAGVGGAEAAALGEKLRRLARGGQILAVTHLPQVASHADLHFKVEKTVAGGRTLTTVRALDDEQHATEVARMLAGAEVTPASLSHARELIAEAIG